MNASRVALNSGSSWSRGTGSKRTSRLLRSNHTGPCQASALPLASRSTYCSSCEEFSGVFYNKSVHGSSSMEKPARGIVAWLKSKHEPRISDVNRINAVGETRDHIVFDHGCFRAF